MRCSRRRTAQALYGALNAAAGRVPLGEALPELYTEGFDAEQIWKQARCLAAARRCAASARASGGDDTHLISTRYPTIHRGEKHTHGRALRRRASASVPSVAAARARGGFAVMIKIVQSLSYSP